MKTHKSLLITTIISMTLGLSIAANAAKGSVGIESTVTSGDSHLSLFGEYLVNDIITLGGNVTPDSDDTAYTVGLRVGKEFGGYADYNSNISALGYSDSAWELGGFIHSKASDKVSFLAKAGLVMVDPASIFNAEAKVSIGLSNNLFGQISGNYMTQDGSSVTTGAVGIGFNF